MDVTRLDAQKLVGGGAGEMGGGTDFWIKFFEIGWDGCATCVCVHAYRTCVRVYFLGRYLRISARTMMGVKVFSEYPHNLPARFLFISSFSRSPSHLGFWPFI